MPPYFWWAVAPSGRHGHAAILHDWLYWEQGVPRAAADRVFETAMAELEVALPVRKAMWAAVRVGGGEYWAEGAALERAAAGVRSAGESKRHPAAGSQRPRQSGPAIETVGRSGEIRTPDPLLPKQVRYQAALRSARP